jgi:hypothetical protein
VPWWESANLNLIIGLIFLVSGCITLAAVVFNLIRQIVSSGGRGVGSVPKSHLWILAASIAGVVSGAALLEHSVGVPNPVFAALACFFGAAVLTGLAIWASGLSPVVHRARSSAVILWVSAAALFWVGFQFITTGRSLGNSVKGKKLFSGLELLPQLGTFNGIGPLPLFLMLVAVGAVVAWRNSTRISGYFLVTLLAAIATVILCRQ